MAVLEFLAVIIILGFIAFRILIFIARHAVGIIILLVVGFVLLIVLASEDMLPKADHTPDNSISQTTDSQPQN